MSLGEEQKKLTTALAHLILFANSNGYTFTLGDAYRDERVFGELGEKKGYGSKNSNHKLRLAVDLNLFWRGEWISSSQHPFWEDLHDYWTTLGGAKAIKGDMNHFSFVWHGRR